MAPRSPTRGISAQAQEADESSHTLDQTKNPVVVVRKRNHAKADRAWAGLRVRLRFGRTLLDETGCERVMRSGARQIGCPQSQNSARQAGGRREPRPAPIFKLSWNSPLVEVESNFNLYAAIHRLAAGTHCRAHLPISHL